MSPASGAKVARETKKKLTKLPSKGCRLLGRFSCFSRRLSCWNESQIVAR